VPEGTFLQSYFFFNLFPPDDFEASASFPTYHGAAEIFFARVPQLSFPRRVPSFRSPNPGPQWDFFHLDFFIFTRFFRFKVTFLHAFLKTACGWMFHVPPPAHVGELFSAPTFCHRSLMAFPVVLPVLVRPQKETGWDMEAGMKPLPGHRPFSPRAILIAPLPYPLLDVLGIFV